MYEMFKKVVLYVVLGSLLMLCIVLGGTTWNFYKQSRASETEIGRLEEELTRSRAAVDEYEQRLRGSIEIITRARSSSGRTEDLLRDSIEIIDELTTILFPVEQTERGLENNGNSRYQCISAADLYNSSIISVE